MCLDRDTAEQIYNLGKDVTIAKILESEAEALRAFDAKEVTEDKYKVLLKFFSSYSGGMCCFGWEPIDQIFDSLSDKDRIEIFGE